VEELLDEVVDVVEVVEDAAVVGRTEATCTVEAVVEVLGDEVLVDEVDEVLADAVDAVNGIAGVGGASKRMNSVKLTTSELKSDAVFPLLLPLLIVSTVLIVSSGSGLGAHCAVAGMRRLQIGPALPCAEVFDAGPI
jgi:hypothetical protein